MFQVRQVTLAKQTSAVTKQIAGPSFGLFTSFGMKDATAVTLQKLSFYALFVPSPVWRRWAERLAPVLRRGGGGT